tara:strand:+ start:1189 stop:1467 length:279 start_codon:yes stop_codon:yes gene_type:complete
MFGWSKWEKFRDRFMHCSIGLNKQEFTIALEVIRVSKSKNKEELVTFLQAKIAQDWGSYTSADFQKNRQAMRFWNTLKKIKDNFVDSENFKS